MASITIKITEEDKDKLVAIAKENDLSVSQIVRKAIKEYLEKE